MEIPDEVLQRYLDVGKLGMAALVERNSKDPRIALSSLAPEVNSVPQSDTTNPIRRPPYFGRPLLLIFKRSSNGQLTVEPANNNATEPADSAFIGGSKTPPSTSCKLDTILEENIATASGTVSTAAMENNVNERAETALAGSNIAASTSSQLDTTETYNIATTSGTAPLINTMEKDKAPDFVTAAAVDTTVGSTTDTTAKTAEIDDLDSETYNQEIDMAQIEKTLDGLESNSNSSVASTSMLIQENQESRRPKRQLLLGYQTVLGLKDTASFLKFCK